MIPAVLYQSSDTSPVLLLLDLAASGDVDAARECVRAGAGLDERAPGSGTTPLYVASELGHLPMVTYLVASGARIDLAAADGSTPLLAAAWRGNVSVCRHLLAHSSNRLRLVRRSRHDGASPLVVSAHMGHLDVCRCLVEHGARLDQPTDAGVTPLLVAAFGGHLDVVRLLRDEGADLDRAGPESRGCTPTFIAAMTGNAAVVACLADGGADVDKANTERSTPLIAAAQAGEYDVVRCLVLRGAHVGLRTGYGFTAEVAAETVANVRPENVKCADLLRTVRLAGGLRALMYENRLEYCRLRLQASRTGRPTDAPVRRRSLLGVLRSIFFPPTVHPIDTLSADAHGLRRFLFGGQRRVGEGPRRIPVAPHDVFTVIIGLLVPDWAPARIAAPPVAH